MRAEVVALTGATILAWGSWGVFSKLAIDRIDQQMQFWGSLIVMPIIFFVYLAVAGELAPLKMDRAGILYAMLGGAGAAMGMVCFYLLLSREGVSVAVPMTALYPAVAVILAFLFLREHVSGSQVLGIVFALAAAALLSR